jgi:hypothetical protein
MELEQHPGLTPPVMTEIPPRAWLREGSVALQARYTHLAWLIVIVGLCGILLPLLFAAGHPISYLRNSDHGLGSPTTQSSANAIQPEHLYRNQSQPGTGIADPQVSRTIPESGDRPGAVP